MADLVMPRLADSMEEGTILRWLKADGDEVARGEELVEIETDKATLTYESDDNGTLSIVAAAGQTLAVGTLIARLAPGNAPEAAEATATEPSPRAEPFLSSRAGAPAAKGDVTIVEPTRVQQTIARRMAESKATIPDFAVRLEVDIEEAVRLRTQMKAQRGDAPSLNDFVVKACGLALREHPAINGAYRDGRFAHHARVNIAIAVATDDALVAPTIFDADLTALTEIARRSRLLVTKARGATITPPEVAGATFTVSNLGMFGVSSFTAVINPGQAATLTVGAATARPVALDGEVVVRHVTELTLVCDHRIVYGAHAARFLGDVRERLEAPLGLLS